MSFFDEDDEPRARSPRTRRPAASGGATDQQTLLIRRAVALGAAVLFLILLVVAVRGCLDSRKKDSLKEYNQRVQSISGESAQTGTQFFDRLKRGDGGDLQTQISQDRVAAESQLSQAKRLDVPGDMAAAQRSLLIALEFRRDALQVISERVGRAGAAEEDTQRQAVNSIAGQMQALLASDVVLLQRVGPLVAEVLRKEGLSGQAACCRQRFLPGVEWLAPTTVARAVGATVSGDEGGDDAKDDRDVAPGTHGMGLVSTTVGSTTMQPGTANRVSGDPTFSVKFANQGENDETDVKVRVTVGSVKGETSVPSIPAGSEATAEVQLDGAPPVDQSVEVEVEVVKVPGEKKTDNNKSTYPAVFSR